MYRCKECGAEYENKPDYCDCGNDEFEMVNVAEQKTQETKTVKIPQEKVEEKPKLQPAFTGTTFAPPPSKKLTFDEQYPTLSRMIKSVDPVSFVIFLFCLIFASYIIFFAWNPKTIETAVENSIDESIPKNIPSIDKIWNNALPVVKKEEPKAEEKIENIIKQIISVQPPEKTEQAKITAKPKTTTVSLKKVETKPKTVQKPTTVTKLQGSTTTQEQAKKAADEAAKKKSEQERIAAEAAHLKALQAAQAKKAEAEKARLAAVAKQEYADYKAQLRNTIGRKIDFTRVIGDGSCTVAFKIDSNGKLINRSFAKQSTNNTLNDVVYAAVMSTPTFNPPPDAYNNETLNLNIKFYNGNFEISLP